MALFNILVGSALLFFGRKVFWLFVAGVGFVAGMSLAANTFNGPEWLNVTVGLMIGLAAALLAIFVQRFAIGLAGFLAGGYIAMQIMPMFNFEGGWVSWAAFIVGGILGAILVGKFLDWALIILSVVAGATVLTDALGLRHWLDVLVFIVLLTIGISYQAKELRKDRRKSR